MIFVVILLIATTGLALAGLIEAVNIFRLTMRLDRVERRQNEVPQ